MHHNHKLKIRVGQIIRGLVLAVCLGYLLVFFHRNRSTLQIAFRLNWRLLAGMLALQLAYYPLQALRLHVIIGRRSDTSPSFLPWLRVFVVGRFVNMVVSQAGNLYRAAYLKKEYRIPYTRYIGGLAAVAWLDLCVSLAVAVTAILIFEPQLTVGPFPLWGLCGLLLAVIMTVPLVTHLIMRRLSFRSRRLEWIRERIAAVVDMTVASLRDIPCLLVVVGLGLIIFTRTVLLFRLYFLVFQIHTSLSELAIFYALFALGGLVMITPGNVGIQEVAWGFLGGLIGVGMAQGVLVSGFGRVVAAGVIACLGVPLGAIDVLRNRNGLSDPAVGTHNTGDASRPM